MATGSPGRPSASCSVHWESWHVTNPAEAEEISAQVYYPNRLVAFDRHAVDFSLAALTIGPFVLGELSYGTEIRMDCRSHDSGYQLNLSRNGFVDARNGSQTSIITPGAGAVFNPEGTTELRRWSAEAVVIGLKIDRDYLQGQAEALLGRQLNMPVRFSMPFTERSSDHSAVTGAIEYGLDLLHSRSSPTVTAAIGPRLAEIITHGLLMSQPSNIFERLHTPSPHGSPRHIQVVQQAILADPAHPWTAVELASKASTSLRTLQIAFKQATGRTVFQFIQEARLDQARRRLLENHDLTVAEIAFVSGFGHLGRFAARYQHRFGELPSNTKRG
jgi:AraC-like DNA-binding protein